LSCYLDGVVEHRFAWISRLRRLVRDDERLVETLTGSYFIAFSIVLAHRFVSFMVQRL
jgi:hypothetical protein